MSNDLSTLAKNLKAKGILTLEDRYELDKVVFISMKSYFESELSDIELNKVQSIEIANLYLMNLKYNDVLDCKDFYDVFKPELRNNLLNYLNELDGSNAIKESVKLKIAVQVLLSRISKSNSLTKPLIIGILPKKGLFSQRQDRGNQWFNDYIEFISRVIQLIFELGENPREMVMQYVMANSAQYLLKTMPNRFKVKPNVSAHETIGDTYMEFLKIGKQYLSELGH